MPSHLKRSLRHTTALVAPRPRPTASALATGVIAGVLLLQPGQVLAADQTWNGPGVDFNAGANWVSGVAPGSSSDTAVFAGTTAPSALSVSANTSLGGIRYDAGAAAYTLTLGQSMQVFGDISNASASTQTINVGGNAFFFYGTAASGSNVTYTLTTGNIQFRDSSVGGMSRFVTGTSGQIALFDTANAVTLGSLSGGGVVRNWSASNTTLTIGGLNESTTYSGAIYSEVGAGTLAVAKEGTGTLTLTGTNTYSGGTTISAGTLQIGDGGATGSITGNVTNNAALTFNRSDSVTFAGNITGSGSVTQSGGGTLILTGTNGWSGGTTITTGSTLQVGDGGAAGTLGSGAIINDGVLAFKFSSIAIIRDVASAISGAGSLNVIGGGIYLTADNTYSGTTTIGTNSGIAIGYHSATGTLGTGAVTNDGQLVAARTNRHVIANDISGSGTFRQSGTGTAVLTGNNSYTGTTTVSSGSTLQVGDGGTSGTLGTGAVTNSGTLAFDRTDIHVVSNAIAGSGSLQQLGTGTTILTGTNAYGSGTTISAGTLQIGNGGTTGSLGTGSVSNSGTLAFDRTDIHVVSNAITGSGSLQQLGTGTTILTGTSTYSGGTTISAGTLQIGSGGTTGSISGNVVNNSALAFNRSDNVTFSGVISGSGSLTQSGGGTLILTGANLYTGTTTVSTGSTLQIGNGGTTGTLGSGAVTNNGVLVVNRAVVGGTITIANAIGGTGSLNVSSGGAILTGANTYSGTTHISASGGIQVGSGGTTGSLGSGAVTNDGLLYLNRSNTYVVSNAIGGSGELRQLGTGTTVLTGNNTRTGLTTIDNGRTLQVGDGGTTGTLGSGAVNNGGALVFDRAGQVTQTGAISGSGTLRKEGTGELVLTGNHGYTGATTVNAGTLSVNGVLSASSQVTVNPGGTLGGNGTVTTTQINGGTLSPGNSVGTIAIGGSLAFTAGSTYRAEIQGASADRADVAGTASLAGTLQLVGLGGAYRFSSPYTLLSATGGLGGTRFDTIANPFGDGVIVTVGYTSGDVQLTLAPKPLTPPEPGPDVPVTPPEPTPPTVDPTPPPAGPRIIGVTAPANAYAIAKSIDKAIANGGDPSSLFGIYNLSAAAIPAAVNSLSGEIHSAAPAMAHIASDQFLRTMLDPMAAGRLEAGSAGPGGAAFSGLVRKEADEPAAPSRLDAPFYSVWGSAYGSYGADDGNAAIGTAKRTIDSAHLATGLDIRLMPGTVAGIAVSGGKARASLPGVLGSIDADVFQAGLYGVTRLGPVKLGGALSYARLDNDVRRSIPALGSSLASSYDTTAWSGRLQASTALFAWNGLALSPLAALQATRARSPAVAEANWAGASNGALALARRSDVTSRSELGLQLDADSALAGVPVTGYVRAAWAHYFQRDAGLTASLTGLPGASFAVTGAEIGRNSALVSAGVAAKLSERVSLGLNLDGELSDRGSRIGGSAQLRISF